MQRSQKKTSHRKQQKGAGSSDWVGSFHAMGADPAQLSRFTLRNINNAPIFHPLQTGTIIPTPLDGIIPTGAYYDAMAPYSLSNPIGPPTPSYAQLGGGPTSYVTKKGKMVSNPWVIHVLQFSEKNGITYSQALKDKNVSKGYVKVTKSKTK